METKTKEVQISYRVGSKIQVKKFDINSDYSFFISETHAVEDATEEELEAFKQERIAAIKDFLDPIAQDEFDTLWDQRLGTDE